ncbi:hypothetical protein EVAR_10788_1 [Eumeta japonica]|uniref:Uncharacterized protein n=1 Tax=Eumeta variegata TaxID=151549 RepID=A0A4C1W7G5_EUMVA|nr:hypothetical protein EVAR_10788_1 [Eumeta japonica]
MERMGRLRSHVASGLGHGGDSATGEGVRGAAQMTSPTGFCRRPRGRRAAGGRRRRPLSSIGNYIPAAEDERLWLLESGRPRLNFGSFPARVLRRNNATSVIQDECIEFVITTPGTPPGPPEGVGLAKYTVQDGNPFGDCQ